eukprot:SAG11_NODE_2687_length_3096_cov_1.771104_2_plen_119_part_00
MQTWDADRSLTWLIETAELSESLELIAAFVNHKVDGRVLSDILGSEMLQLQEWGSDMGIPLEDIGPLMSEVRCQPTTAMFASTISYASSLHKFCRLNGTRFLKLCLSHPQNYRARGWT